MSGTTGRAVVGINDGNESTTSNRNCGPAVGDKLYINKGDMTVSDLSQGMTTTIEMAVDDQVYGLVQVTGLEHIVQDKKGLYRDTDADSDETIDPDEEVNEGLEFGGPKPYPYISRDTSLSSLTFDKCDFYKVDSEGVLNQPAAIKLGDESTFDEVYTVNHSPVNSPLDVASFPSNMPTGWSFASTRTAPEEKINIHVGEPVEYLTSLSHLKEVTRGPNDRDDIGSNAQNTYSDKSMSSKFAAYVYHRLANSSRKKKLSIVAAVCVFLVFVSVLLVVGFRHSSADPAIRSTSSAESFNEPKTQQLPNSENTSVATEQIAPNASSVFDDTQDEKDLPNESTTSVPSTTTSPVTSMFQYDKEDSPAPQYVTTHANSPTDLMHEPTVPPNPELDSTVESPTLELTPSPVVSVSTSTSISTLSQSNKPHVNMFNKSPTQEPVKEPVSGSTSDQVPTRHPRKRQTNKPHNTEPIILKPDNPEPNNPEPNYPRPNNPKPNNPKPNPKPDNPKPSQQVAELPSPVTIQMTRSPSKPPSLSPTFTTPVSSFSPSTNTTSPTLGAASPSSHPTGPPQLLPTRKPATIETEKPAMPPTIEPTRPSPSLHPTRISTSEPTPFPTAEPTNDPTPAPTPAPTPDPTPDPTPAPTPDPTPDPTPAPTPDPTPDPTPAPTPDPTPDPTPAPTPDPTPDPTPAPTPDPTPDPTPRPTDCLERKFSYNRNQNQCTNDDSEGEYDTPWGCCGVHFKDSHCEFEDVCDYYTMRPTPVPTSYPTPPPTPDPTPEPIAEPTEGDVKENADKRAKRILMRLRKLLIL